MTKNCFEKLTCIVIFLGNCKSNNTKTQLNTVFLSKILKVFYI